MDSWEDRRFFLGFANEKDLQTLTDPETRVSRVPLFYTCFLRVLKGSTGKTGLLAKNPVFQAGNRVSGLGNVPARCENHAWGFVTTRCVGCVAFVAYTSLRTHRLRCVACVAFVTYRAQRTERLRCVGCVRLVTFDALRCVGCIRSHRSDLNRTM